MAAGSTMTTYRLDPETGERVVVAVGRPPRISERSHAELIALMPPHRRSAYNAAVKRHKAFRAAQ